MSEMKPLSAGYYIRRYLPMLILMVVIAGGSILTRGKLLSQYLLLVYSQNSYLLILAIGMLIIMLNGKIDLSIGSQVALAGTIFAVVTAERSMDIFPAILLCLLIGVLIGAFQGALIAYVKIPSLIVTLINMLLIKSIMSMHYSAEYYIAISEELHKIVYANWPGTDPDANSSILSILVCIVLSAVYLAIKYIGCKRNRDIGTETPHKPLLIAEVLIIVSAINIFTYQLSRREGIPCLFLFIATLVIIYTFAAEKIIKTKSDNIGGAEASINEYKLKVFLAFVNMGFLSALTGLLVTGQYGAATQSAGDRLVIYVILACLAGGVSIVRRVGSVRGVVNGTLIVGFLSIVLSAMHINIYVEDLIIGILLIIAAAPEIYSMIKGNKLSSQRNSYII